MAGLEIAAAHEEALDATAIVLDLRGVGDRDASSAGPAAPATGLLWEGRVPGSGAGPQAEYWVRLYRDGTAHCQCPDWHFRGLGRLQLTYVCRHIRRARAEHATPL